MAFDQQELNWVHERDSNVECFQIVATSGLYHDMTNHSYTDDIANSNYNWLNWNISELETTMGTIRLVHKYNRKIIVFPFVQIDLPLTWRTFANAGADFILTDKDPKYVI